MAMRVSFRAGRGSAGLTKLESEKKADARSTAPVRPIIRIATVIGIAAVVRIVATVIGIIATVIGIVATVVVPIVAIAMIPRMAIAAPVPAIAPIVDLNKIAVACASDLHRRNLWRGLAWCWQSKNDAARKNEGDG